MVIDMKKDKLVIMDWGGVVESHSEESYLAHNVVSMYWSSSQRNRYHIILMRYLNSLLW